MSAIKFPEMSSVQCSPGIPGIEHPLTISSHADQATFYSAQGTTWINTDGLLTRWGTTPSYLLNARELRNYATKARGCAAAGGLTPAQTTALRDLGNKLDEIGRTRIQTPKPRQ